MVYPFSKQPDHFRERRSLLLPLSLVAGSLFFGVRLYKWWSEYRESMEDEQLFGETSASPLLSLDGGFPPKVQSQTLSAREGSGFECSSGVLTQEERGEALRLARMLLGETPISDSSSLGSGESSDSGVTDVSLNYQIAVELEREARDSLTEAVVQGEVARAAARGRPLTLADYSTVLPLVVEYLEVSMDREELRARRAAKRLVDQQNGGLRFSSGAGRHGPDDFFINDVDEISRRVAQMRSADISKACADLFSRSEEMDRLLRAPANNRWDDCMEMDWGGDDEADLMAYLDQDDSAGYANRAEARVGAQLQRDLRTFDDEEMYDDDAQEEESEDLDDELEKADFERMLLSKLYLLAESVGMEDAACECRAKRHKEGEALGFGGGEPRQPDTVDDLEEDHLQISDDADSDTWETEGDFEEEEVESSGG
ncbi:uncharacterized protein TEOVI_000026200 [Trypanosoma equiperdum]|uniref:Uncharacterized protein n=2 Tax=Trypanozoon TaxID=39700 RepID=Q57XK2_TRYB2|nr:hypothetical protein, conserved [Trypanosoma brucei brucei TREU927]AAX69667.1 hypothetical protein, conserved [Trypanosoma brucei]AAZ10385.1 hypothetical protein, conserved [Trypanosoma brucei brucei TREU927]SCU66052.1 hypothetical protein, conserved [Trypanosoma equiperdum]